MQQYRLFFFDADGRLSKAHEFVTEDDERAIHIAEAWREGREMELWQHDRRIRQWRSGPDAPSSPTPDRE